MIPAHVALPRARCRADWVGQVVVSRQRTTDDCCTEKRRPSLVGSMTSRRASTARNAVPRPPDYIHYSRRACV